MLPFGGQSSPGSTVAPLMTGAGFTIETTAVARLLAGFGSAVAAPIVAVRFTGPDDGHIVPTFTAMAVVSPTAIAGLLHDIVPAPPTGGAVHIQPAGALTDLNVSVAGTVLVTTMLLAGDA